MTLFTKLVDNLKEKIITSSELWEYQINLSETMLAEDFIIKFKVCMLFFFLQNCMIIMQIAKYKMNQCFSLKSQVSFRFQIINRSS